MVKTSELARALDDELRVADFQDGQVNGLQVEGRPEIERVATAVSLNQAALDEAIAWGADALITHHGLLWQSEGWHFRGVRAQRLRNAVKRDLNLFSYHLPLDAHPTLGNNAALADAAGTTHEPGFMYKGNRIGAIGRLSQPASFSDWLARFQDALACPVDTGPQHIWDFGPDDIESIGFVSGAAPYQVADAIDLGLDVYVTGEPAEAVYHLAKEAGIHFLALGHYATERWGVQRLGAFLVERFGVEHRFIEVETRV